MTDKLNQIDKSANELSKEINRGVSLLALGRENYEGEETVANFNPADPAHRKMFMQSAGDPDYKPDSMDGEVFMLKYWMAERGSFINQESGDEVIGVRVCMWDSKGRMLSAVSWAVTRFLNKLRKVYGEGPYDPPIGLSFENKIRGDKKRTYKVEIVES